MCAKTSTGGCSSGYYATDGTLPDKVTSYSNSAPFLTLLAPSNQAATTDIVGSGGYAAGDYDAAFGGTSAACPYAAGSAAVLQSAAKTLTGSFLTPAEVRAYLVNTGDAVTDGKVAITKPRVNLGGAVDAVTSGLPIVSISPSDGTATEAGTTPGEFTVSRTGETAAAMTVDFAVAGTATPDSDYAGIGASVTIPAGAASATIAVTPIDDTAVESDETVIMNLGPAAAYWLGNPGATVTIQDDDGPTLAEALDTALTVTTGGGASWAAQTSATHDGADAAQSGALGNGQSTWIQTTATGAGVSFWWRVSSESGWDYLRFSIDGVVKASISGEVPWQQKVFAMGAGSHTLRWEYSKDTECCAVGSDRAWLDQLEVSTTAPPTVTVTANNPSATEAGPTTGQYTVTRTGETTAALTVNFAVTGTATSASDYASIGTSVTIPAGESGATVTVTPVRRCGHRRRRDGAADADLRRLPSREPVERHGDDSGRRRPNAGRGAGHGADGDDRGNASWWGQISTTHDGVDAAQSGTLGNGQTSWVETTATGAGVSFWWRVSSESGWDYLRFSIDGVVQASISGEVPWQQRTFAMAAGSHTLRWEYAKDAACCTGGSDRAWLDQLEVSATPPPTVTVTANDPSATEAGTTTGQFTVTRSGETTAALTVNFAVAGTAASPSDYASIGTSIIITAGASSATVTVTPVDDAVTEAAETVVLTLSTGFYLIGGSSSATVTIQDDDGPTLAAALDTALTVTSGGNASWWGQTSTTHDGVDAVQSGTLGNGQASWVETTAAGAGVSFWWRVSSETCCDYLRFSIDGVVQASIRGEVPWQQKTFAMAAGSHTLRWEYAKDASWTGGSDRGWVDQLVVSATPPPTVTVTANDETAAETGPTTGQYTVTRTGETTAALTVTFSVSGTATSPSDYASIGTSVTIPAGAASATVTVTPVDDAVIEKDETVVLTLAAIGSYLVGSPASATVTIQENDLPTLAAALDTALTMTTGGDASWTGQTATTLDGVDAVRSGAVGDGQSSWMQVTATGTSVGFYWKVSSENGWDYLRFLIDGVEQAVISGEVNWQYRSFAMPLGSHTLRWEYAKDATCCVGGTDRAWVDMLSVWTSTPPTVTVTASDPTATEAGPTRGQFTMTRTGATALSLTVTFAVTGTAGSGTDYTGIGTSLTIPAGASSAMISVTPIDDGAVENDETVIVSLSANAAYAVGSPASGTVTIASDDLVVPPTYVLWTRSDIGKAKLWQIDPSLPTGPAQLKRNIALYSASGVGAPWQATSYTHVSATEGYVLWTRGDIGKANLWQIDPSLPTGPAQLGRSVLAVFGLRGRRAVAGDELRARERDGGVRALDAQRHRQGQPLADRPEPAHRPGPAQAQCHACIRRPGSGRRGRRRATRT